MNIVIPQNQFSSSFALGQLLADKHTCTFSNKWTLSFIYKRGFYGIVSSDLTKRFTIINFLQQ